MAFGWKQYWKPTPKNIRKFADALSAASLAISAYSFMSDYKLFAYITLVTTFVAKLSTGTQRSTSCCGLAHPQSIRRGIDMKKSDYQFILFVIFLIVSLLLHK